MAAAPIPIKINKAFSKIFNLFIIKKFTFYYLSTALPFQ